VAHGAWRVAHPAATRFTPPWVSGIEEDFIKCLAPTYMGKFDLDGKTLRKKGINRIGNMLVPNKNYCLFEDWMMPVRSEA